MLGSSAFLLLTISMSVAIGAPRCSFSASPELSFDLSDTTGLGRFVPTGLPPIVVAGPLLADTNYFFSACEEFLPAQVAPNCGAGSAALLQLNLNQPDACSAVARLAGAVAAPLGGGRVGLKLELRGGDECGNGISRHATVLYECAAAFHGAVVDEGPAPCHYTLRLFGPSGCPTQCARSAGGVCGGPFRGACVLSGSSAGCTCRAGWGGPGCGVAGAAAAAAAGALPALGGGAAPLAAQGAESSAATDVRFLWLLGLLAGAAAARACCSCAAKAEGRPAALFALGALAGWALHAALPTPDVLSGGALLHAATPLADMFPARSPGAPGGGALSLSDLAEQHRARYLNLLEKAVTGSLFPDAGACKKPGCSGREPYVAALREGGNDWPPHALTMAGNIRMRNVREAIEYAVAAGVPGDFLELGTWRGGACVVARAVLDSLGETRRTVHAFDAWQKIGNYGPDDEYLETTEAGVRDAFARVGLHEGVRFWKGLFSDTLPHFVSANKGAPIAVLRLDGNFYFSYQDAMYALYELVPVGGVVIWDDLRGHAAVQRFWAVRCGAPPYPPSFASPMQRPS
jgi:hypothetical protein